MRNSFRLSRAAILAALAGVAGTTAAYAAEEMPTETADLFLRDSFFESFSARLADQLDNRMRHARRFGGGLQVYGLQGPDTVWGAYRGAAQYDPEVALQFSAAEAERESVREARKGPFDPAMALPGGLGIFLLGDTGVGETGIGNNGAREFWTHSITGGMDYRFADAALAGFAVSYSGGEADLGRTDYRSEAMTWSLFASLGEGPWHLDGSYNMGTLSFGEAAESAGLPASLADLTGTGTGDHVWTHLDAGYNFKLGDLELGPVAEFRHATARFDRFTEDTVLGAMSVPEREVEYARVGVGAAASVKVDFDDRHAVNLWGRATYQTGFGDTAPAIEAALEDGRLPVAIEGAGFDHSFIRTQMGLTAELGDGTAADVSYRTDLGRDDWQSHTVAASVRLKF